MKNNFRQWKGFTIVVTNNVFREWRVQYSSALFIHFFLLGINNFKSINFYYYINQYGLMIK